MDCQTVIARQIVDHGADSILAVKDNPAKLHDAIQDDFKTAAAANFAGVSVTHHEKVDGGHGGCELRRCWLVDDLRTLPEVERWAKLRGIAMVEAERNVDGQISCERPYYITSLAGHARQAAHGVRAHWGVENQLHWRLDVTFDEDDCRIRRDLAPANFNTLRQFAMNLLKPAAPSMITKRKRFETAINDQFRANVVFGQ